MGFLASLFGSGRQATAPPPAPSTAKDISAIDLAHESDGIFYHGTLTLINGSVGVTWTMDDGNSKKSQAVAMTEPAFRTIWDSVSDIPDFKAALVTGPGQQLDPKVNYVIAVVSSVGGQKKLQAYMIPAATASPAFREWLGKTGYTGK